MKSSFISLALVITGCGSSGATAAPPVAAGEPTAPAASAALAPSPAAAPVVAASAATPAAPAPAKGAEPSASSAPAKADSATFQLVTKTADGRPMVQYMGEKGLTTTLGVHGGVLKAGAGATLRVPDGALREGLNVTLELDAKARGPRGAVGLIYKIGPQVASRGPKFQLVLAVPAGVKSPSFALEVVTADAKTGKPKSDWQVLAPTHVFVGDNPDLAVLELDALAETHVTLTTSAPGAPK